MSNLVILCIHFMARLVNLAVARKSPRYHPPRPWRSKDEAYMIRRYAFWWWTCRDSNKPSGRSWARQLGISHTWLQKLVREFQRNPDEMWRLQLAEGDPRLTDLGDAQASPRYHKPRPFRSEEESHMVKRFVYLWFTAAGSKPSTRAWARQLGISRTWLRKLVKEFRKDPSEMLQAQAAEGDPRFADLANARERSQEMRQRGELRPLKFRWWKRRKQGRDPPKMAPEIPFSRAWLRRVRANRMKERASVAK